MSQVKRLGPLIRTQLAAALQELCARPAIVAQQSIKQVHGSSFCACQRAGCSYCTSVLSGRQLDADQSKAQISSKSVILPKMTNGLLSPALRPAYTTPERCTPSS